MQTHGRLRDTHANQIRRASRDPGVRERGRSARIAAQRLRGRTGRQARWRGRPGKAGTRGRPLAPPGPVQASGSRPPTSAGCKSNPEKSARVAFAVARFLQHCRPLSCRQTGMPPPRRFPPSIVAPLPFPSQMRVQENSTPFSIVAWRSRLARCKSRSACRGAPGPGLDASASGLDSTAASAGPSPGPEAGLASQPEQARLADRQT